MNAEERQVGLNDKQCAGLLDVGSCEHGFYGDIILSPIISFAVFTVTELDHLKEIKELTDTAMNTELRSRFTKHLLVYGNTLSHVNLASSKLAPHACTHTNTTSTTQSRSLSPIPT